MQHSKQVRNAHLSRINSTILSGIGLHRTCFSYGLLKSIPSRSNRLVPTVFLPGSQTCPHHQISIKKSKYIKIHPEYFDAEKKYMMRKTISLTRYITTFVCTNNQWLADTMGPGYHSAIFSACSTRLPGNHILKILPSPG